MPHDPHAQFDQSVLEMIEHSPIGAVPITPSYQDALNRLYAAHQVYADADHKDGHVTARSLAKLPSFYAANLEAIMRGEADLSALESNAGIVDRYVQSLPAARHAKAETFRLKVAGRPIHHRPKQGGVVIHDPVHTIFLVPGTGPHPGLPGNYLFGSVLQSGVEGPAQTWSVVVHDSDDGVARLSTADAGAALAKLVELLESAPFNMNELGALGFELDL